MLDVCDCERVCVIDALLVPLGVRVMLGVPDVEADTLTVGVLDELRVPLALRVCVLLGVAVAEAVCVRLRLCDVDAVIV